MRNRRASRSARRPAAAPPTSFTPKSLPRSGRAPGWARRMGTASSLVARNTASRVPGVMSLPA